MIDKVLELLNSGEYLGYSENIEIAKGKYKLPLTIKEKLNQTKRSKAWRLRKQ